MSEVEIYACGTNPIHASEASSLEKCHIKAEIPKSSMSAVFDDGLFYNTGISARYGGYPAEKAVDGFGTPQHVDEFWELAVGNNTESDLIVTLDETYDIFEVEVWPESRSGAREGAGQDRYSHGANQRMSIG